MQVLLLEPDHWRFLGIAQILQSEPGITLLGEHDHEKILLLNSAPPDISPDIILLSYSLALDFQLSIVEQLHKLFPKAHILVDGYDDTLETIADVLRAGAAGYFLLSSEPPKLLNALNLVQKGFIWAPREAVALLARNGKSGKRRHRPLISITETSILKLLQQGLGNKEIARILGVADVTVKSHLTRLYRKLGVHSRLELLAYAVNHDLITAESPRVPPRRVRGA